MSLFGFRKGFFLLLVYGGGSHMINVKHFVFCSHNHAIALEGINEQLFNHGIIKLSLLLCSF